MHGAFPALPHSSALWWTPLTTSFHRTLNRTSERARAGLVNITKPKKVSSFFHSKFMNVDCIFCQKTVRQDTLFSFWSRWGYKSPWTSYCSSLQLFTVTASSRKFTGCKWTIIASRKRSATLLTRPCELNVSVMDDTKRFMWALPSCFMPLQQNFHDYKLSLIFLWH